MYFYVITFTITYIPMVTQCPLKYDRIKPVTVEISKVYFRENRALSAVSYDTSTWNCALNLTLLNNKYDLNM